MVAVLVEIVDREHCATTKNVSSLRQQLTNSHAIESIGSIRIRRENTVKGNPSWRTQI